MRAASTLFPEGVGQVWVAKHCDARKYFGSLQGVDDFFKRHHVGTETVYEEVMDGDQPCSGIWYLSTSVTFGTEAPRQTWKDTGWRVWREQ